MKAPAQVLFFISYFIFNSSARRFLTWKYFGLKVGRLRCTFLSSTFKSLVNFLRQPFCKPKASISAG
jgi:hypothetical protein